NSLQRSARKTPLFQTKTLTASIIIIAILERVQSIYAVSYWVRPTLGPGQPGKLLLIVIT
ncbi:hypothetical protein ACFL2Q_13950, partial [Thermodesulfobacteriota bacterium]